MLIVGLSCSVFSQTQVAPGAVSGIWMPENSPYYINGDIQIPSGAVLEIKPGTEVRFMGAFEFDVKGQLLAVGTLRDSIIFTADNKNVLWTAIVFDPFGGNPDDIRSHLAYCRIEYATNYSGGAFNIYGHSKLLVEHCKIQHNRGTLGGALYIKEANPVFQYNQFLFNEASSSGAAIWTISSGALLVNNIISNNTSPSEGAVYIWQTDSIRFHSNIVCNNQVGQKGAGIYVRDCSPVLLNNTIANNLGNGHTGGIYGSNAAPVFYNTIVYGNGKGFDYFEYSQVCISDDFMPDFYYCAIQGGVNNFELSFIDSYTGTAENIITSDPLFIQPADTFGLANNGFEGSWGLQTVSPCINAGTPDISGFNLPEFDFQEKIRVKDTIEIGAWENSNGKPQIVPLRDLILKDTYQYTVSVSFSDPNPEDEHTLSVNSDNSNVLIQNISEQPTGATFDLEITRDWVGNASVTLIVTDNSSTPNNADTMSFVVNCAKNNRPVIEPIANTSVNEDELLTVTVNFSDADVDDRHTIVLLANEYVESVQYNGYSSGSQINILFKSDWNGQTELNLVVADQWKAPTSTDTVSFTVTVSPVNDAPMIEPVPDISFKNTETYEFSIPYFDVDGDDNLTHSLTTTEDSLVVGFSVQDNSVLVNLNVLGNWSGNTEITYRLSDAEFSTQRIIYVEVREATIISTSLVYGTWTKELSPYYILTNITIPDDSTLTIEPGVTVFFDDYKQFVVKGTLLARGTADDSIRFSSLNKNWRGVELMNGIDTLDYMSDNDSTIFEYCSFSNISAWSYGSLTIKNFSKFEVKHCLFKNNMASSGGGIAIIDAEAMITHCTFDSNVASYRGGAISLDCDWGTRAWITDNVMKNNIGGRDGGAIYSYGADLYLINNLLVGNRSDDYGGAISAIWTSGYFYNNTICKNSSQKQGGGIYNYGSIEVVNSILWENKSPQGAQFYSDGLNGFNFRHSIIQHGESIVNQQYCIFFNPLLDSLYRPLPESRAINAGTLKMDTLLIHDLAGKLRVYSDSIDIGAYELQTAALNRQPFLELTEEVTLMFNSSVKIDYAVDDPDTSNHLAVKITYDNSELKVINNQFDDYQGSFELQALGSYVGIDTLFVTVNDNSGAVNAYDSVKLVVNTTSQNVTVAPDTIYENTIWDYDVIEVNNHLVVKAGATLNIMPGTRVVFNGAYRVYVYGNLNTYGTKGDPIVFTAKDTIGLASNDFMGWLGIALENVNMQDTSVFNHTIFEMVNTSLTNWEIKAALWVKNNSRVHLNNCTFSKNLSDETAGLYVSKADSVAVDSCTFVDNVGQGPSAISSQSLIKISHSIFKHNYSETFGTLMLSGNYAWVSNCLFDSNSGDPSYVDGTGLTSTADSLFVTNCVFVNNISAFGIIELWGNAYSQISNCNFINNKGTRMRTAIYSIYSQGKVENCLFWNPDLNYALQNYSGESAEDTSYYQISNCLIENPDKKINIYADTVNIFSTNPYFENLDLNFALSDSSPCIDKGLIDSLYAGEIHGSTDFYGNPRVEGNTIDIGAVEFRVNSPIIGIYLSDTVINEKQTAPYFVTKITTEDQDKEEQFSYSLYTPELGELNNESFYVSNDSLFAKVPFVFSESSQLTVGIQTKSTRGDSLERLFTLYINDIPRNIQLSNQFLEENSGVSFEVATVSATDNQSLIYALADNRLKEMFAFDENRFIALQDLDYEADQPIYHVLVQATDAYGAQVKQILPITLTNKEEIPEISYLLFNLEENASDVMVCSFSLYDPDYKVVTPTLIEVNYQSDFRGVTLNNNSLIATLPFNYEEISSLDILMNYADETFSIDTLLKIAIVDVNEAPMDINLDSAAVQENQSVGTFIGNLMVVDEDSSENFSYFLSDENRFAVKDNKLLTNKIFNFEEQAYYPLEITVTDKGGLSTSKNFEIEILDLNEVGILETDFGSIQVFPNPTTGWLSIESSASINKINLFNEQGLLVLTSSENNDGAIKLDLTNYEAGVYIMQFTMSNRLIYTRIIKE